MSGPVGAWIWEDKGPWFGVPFHNFAGWVLVNGLIVLLYRLAARWLELRPLGAIRRWPETLAILGYGTLWVSDLFLGYPVETKLVAPFVMGIPTILALLRLYTPPRG